MVAKILFLVLLGTALVLSSPIQEAGSTEVLFVAAAAKKVKNVADDALPEFVLPSLEEIVGDEGGKGSTTVAPIESKIQQFKKKVIDWFYKTKEQLMKLINNGAAKIKKLNSDFLTAKEETLKLIDDIKTTYLEAKKAGKEAVDNVKKLYNEVKETWDTLKKTSQDLYAEIISIARASRKAFKMIKASSFSLPLDSTKL